jgi:ABC-type proline/glycine betaine transport system permease subunit
MGFLRAIWTFFSQMAGFIQSILSLLNLFLWLTIFYVGYRIYLDPLLIYQLPVIIVKTVSGHSN